MGSQDTQRSKTKWLEEQLVSNRTGTWPGKLLGETPGELSARSLRQAESELRGACTPVWREAQETGINMVKPIH